MRKTALITALAVIVADWVSKYWVLNILDLDRVLDIPLLPFLNLTYVMNEGVSMGMLQMDTDTGRWILIAATSAIAALVAWWAIKAENRLQAVAFGAIFGGAIGNIHDRIVYGAVVDFVHLHVGDWSFWVFNVADSAITLSVCALLFDGLREAKNDPKTETHPNGGQE